MLVDAEPNAMEYRGREGDANERTATWPKIAAACVRSPMARRPHSRGGSAACGEQPRAGEGERHGRVGWRGG